MQTSAERKTWRQVLREQGRTQVWLAAQTGVSFSTVYAYSIGARRTPEAWLRRVATVLGVPAALLLADIEEVA